MQRIDATFMVRRSEGGERSELVSYRVPWEPGMTVLQGLLYIREAVDPTLAIGYDCRFKSCGLCGVRVNGRAQLACVARVARSSETVVEPLRSLPVVRDLVVDRGLVVDLIRRYRLYPDTPPGESRLGVTALYSSLAGCVDCLCCMDNCPRFDPGRIDRFGGPWLFVKLAQQQLMPGNRIDRRAQARELGVSDCVDCRGGCRCTVGVDIRRGIRLLA